VTPPTVEYWRVWSDTLGAWHQDRKGNRRSYWTLTGAERAARQKNTRCVASDWRPVRVRETVVEE
jgi:hypothetical protein